MDRAVSDSPAMFKRRNQIVRLFHSLEGFRRVLSRFGGCLTPRRNPVHNRRSSNWTCGFPALPPFQVGQAENGPFVTVDGSDECLQLCTSLQLQVVESVMNIYGYQPRSYTVGKCKSAGSRTRGLLPAAFGDAGALLWGQLIGAGRPFLLHPAPEPQSRLYLTAFFMLHHHRVDSRYRRRKPPKRPEMG